MLLVDERFRKFILWLASLPCFSVGALETALEDLGGLDGAIKNEYYISAYELLGRALVQEKSFEHVLNFFRAEEQCLSENPEHLYYFVESIIGHSLVWGGEPEVLISSAPVAYRAFLKKRFLPR